MRWENNLPFSPLWLLAVTLVLYFCDTGLPELEIHLAAELTHMEGVIIGGGRAGGSVYLRDRLDLDSTGPGEPIQSCTTDTGQLESQAPSSV